MFERLDASRPGRSPLGLLAAALVLGAAATAGAAGDGSEETGAAAMLERLRALEAEIAHAEARAADARDRTVAERSEAIGVLVRDVLADADTRIARLDAGGRAGHDGSFFVESEDGRYRLEFGGFMQVVGASSHQNDAPIDDDRWGVGLRRIRLKVSGHLGTERLRYEIGFGSNRVTGVWEVSDLAFEYDLDDTWALKVGRSFADFDRERAVSSRRMLLVQRSLVDRAFFVNREYGVGLIWQTDRVRGTIDFQDQTPGALRDRSWQAATRAEVLLAGDWSTVSSFRALRDVETAVLVGGAVFHRRLDRPAGTVGAGFGEEETRWTGDVTVKGDGWSLHGAVIGANLNRDAATDRDRIGAVVQGAIALTDVLEFVGRYEWGDADDGSDEMSIVSAGLTRFLRGHDLRLSVDAGYAFSQVGPFWASAGAYWRADAPGQDGQVVVRTMLQLVF